ncbi:hypothetical protein H2200_000392 [Cladophialophora chaetospira]|uniref:Alginate lyase domain-containing protein n=1 Tax=Cladophialophora chaetospira TaxID=386627 RepID=A0AA39CQW5_9EURO|nr:hypothetical protein H2200_000392 [Cladophialophora chaetospira]
MRALSTLPALMVLFLQLVIQVESSPSQPQKRVNCATDARWQLTSKAWNDASVDRNLASWWKETMKSNPSADFANELASQFGAKSLGFNCSIDSPQTCTVPGCQPYVDNGDPPWPFLALNAVVNLNAYFNRVHDGTQAGQADFTDKAGSIAQTFFPWGDPKLGATDAAIWVDATVGAFFSFLTVPSRAVTAGARAIGSFIQAGLSQLQLDLIPNPSLTLNQGMAAMTAAAGSYAQQWRATIEDWDSTLFSGEVDSQNHTILDYLQGGAFVNLDLPEAQVFEEYWLQSLLSRTINSQWRTRANFVTFAYTDDPDIDIGPNNSKYYSAEDGGVYYLYQWRASKSRLEEPDGMEQLEAIAGGIEPWQVTKSFAESFRLAGFNYTALDTLNGLQSSLNQSSGSYFADGAAAPGFWTIPVCNMTEFWRWNGQYNHTKLAPCCCGDNCTDTRAFILAANLNVHSSFMSQYRHMRL